MGSMATLLMAHGSVARRHLVPNQRAAIRPLRDRAKTTQLKAQGACTSSLCRHGARLVRPASDAYFSFLVAARFSPPLGTTVAQWHSLRLVVQSGAYCRDLRHVLARDSLTVR